MGNQSACCMICHCFPKAMPMSFKSSLNLYISRSRFIGLIFDFCLVIIAILAFVDWFNMRRPPELAAYSEIVRYVGKVELIRPWKTSPYVALKGSSDLDLRFSCYGPYQNQYWCNTLDFAAIANRTDVEILAFEGLVYEVRAGGRILLPYDLQVRRFQSAMSSGPSNLKLAFSLFSVLTLVLSIRSRYKKAEHLYPGQT